MLLEPVSCLPVDKHYHALDHLHWCHHYYDCFGTNCLSQHICFNIQLKLQFMLILAMTESLLMFALLTSESLNRN
jgi:hypothetical protein